MMKTVAEWCTNNDQERSSIFEERLAAATHLINQGNDLFKENKLLDAKMHYLAAGYHADFDAGQQWDLTTEHKSQIRAILIRILLNVANNALKMKEHNFANLACSIGIDLCKTDSSCPQDTVAKFHYRRARALLDLLKYDGAVADARKAMELMPTDSAVREVFLKASLGVRRAKEESDAMWRAKNIFASPDGADIPKVDLVLTDNDGKPIVSTSGRKQSSLATTGSVDKSLWASLMELICCKRKPKSA